VRECADGTCAREQEFSCYLREVKNIEPEVLSNFDRKKYWKDYMEGASLFVVFVFRCVMQLHAAVTLLHLTSESMHSLRDRVCVCVCGAA
jgi:hypothetical protein